MIGVVGPQDSVEQVLRIATTMGKQSRTTGLVYSDPSETLEIVRQAADKYSVILFTGRIPFSIANSSRVTPVRLDYIPHEGQDLMRVLARILIDRAPSGTVASLSLDSVEQHVADRVVGDLGGAPTQVHTIPLVLESHGSAFSEERIAREHVRLLRDGVTDTALTCIHSVHGWLRDRGYPVTRVTHSEAVIWATLEKTLLVDQLARANKMQTAVVLLSPRQDDSQLPAGLIDDVLEEAATFTGAKIVSGKNESKLVTTRRGVEAWLSDYRVSSRLSGGDLARGVTIGVGLGDSVPLAEQNARTAISFSRAASQLFVVTADGESFSFGSRASTYRFDEMRTDLLDFSREIGLSTVSLQRLVRSLESVDFTAVTARQLAASHNISARTARRYLAALVSVDMAELVGKRTGPKAGRPEQLYQVDLGELKQRTSGLGRF